MQWDALAAISSFGQFIVVLAAAFFGFAQLKQMRRQSELQATIPYFAYTRGEEFNRAFRIVRAEIFDRNSDPQLRAAIAQADINDPRVASLFNLANFFNELGVLVQEDMIDRQTVLSFFRGQILATWELFEPFVIARRTYPGAGSIFVNF